MLSLVKQLLLYVFNTSQDISMRFYTTIAIYANETYTRFNLSQGVLNPCTAIC